MSVSSVDDARRQLVRLTEAGTAAFSELDTLQAATIDRIIGPLDADQREGLVTAMGRIRTVLGDEQLWSSLVLRAPEPGDLGWVVERHGARYAAEYGWDVTFEALVARVVADYADRRDGPPQAAWIAAVDGERVGSVFCTAAEAPGVAQLRLLLVEPRARGLGVGTRLVDECLRFAGRSGYRRMVSWTNDVLVEARRIYQRAGFRLDRTEPHTSFGRDLVGEFWSRDL